ncbi:hypothetical protein O0L34_g2006 [Tuta absoluta]|nr:hypothetical protein O0L34_g2006 [Tuta absoluta]
MANLESQENDVVESMKEKENEEVTISVDVDVDTILISDEDEKNCKLTPLEKDECRRARKRQRRADAPKNKICDQCSKAFKTNAELKRHERSHTKERPFICASCGNSYTQLSHLQEHNSKHHSAKEKSIKCEECFSTFYRKCDLERHMKTHTGERPWKCELCPKAFTQKGNLVMHIKVHADDRPYACTECDKRFITQCKMKRHMHIKHARKLNKVILEHVIMVNDEQDDECDVMSDE